MIDAYWDNARIGDYINSCRRAAANSLTEDPTLIPTFYVNIYVSTELLFSPNGKVSDLTAESIDTLNSLEDLASEIERRADDPFFEDIPEYCYGHFEELHPIEISPHVHIPLAAAFRAVLPESYFDVIDDIISRYKTGVKFHIKNF